MPMRFKLYSAAALIAVLYLVNGYIIFYSDEKTGASLGLSGAAELSENAVPIRDIQAYINPSIETSNYPILNPDVPEPKINARSAVVYDLASSRILFEKESESRLPIASLTKILSAVVAIENFSLDDVVTVGPDSLKVDGEKQDLYLNERITVENLLKMMLVSSSNDAAYALRSYASTKDISFIRKMNEKAEELKMESSRFVDPAGLNDVAYSGTHDLKKLIEYSLKYDFIWQTLASTELSVSSVDGKINHYVRNTNKLLGVMPNILGGKTGNTDGALGCMILVLDVPKKDDKILIIVLGSTERFDDARKLGVWVFDAFRWE